MAPSSRELDLFACGDPAGHAQAFLVWSDATWQCQVSFRECLPDGVFIVGPHLSEHVCQVGLLSTTWSWIVKKSNLKFVFFVF